MNYKKLLALVLAILMALTLTACGGGGGGGDKPSEPTFKKTFTYSVGGEPTYMDPARCGDSVTAEIHNEIWYPLFYLTEDGSPAKGDCIDYTIDDSGTVYTFKLDPNAKWSDGVALTADQYVYGIKRCIGMGYEDVGYLTMITNYIVNAEAHVGDAVADMDDVGVKALDDYTLEITLNAKCPFFVSLLPTQVFAAVRSEFAPEKDSEWSNTVGYPTTGAFYPTKIDSASEYILEKNPYFALADQVYCDKLIAKIMPSMEASQMAFQTGEIDYDTSADSSATKVADLADAIDIHGNINYYMNINCYTSNEALQNVEIRRALQLGIDRSAFVTALDAGDVYYELYGFLPVGIPDFKGDFRTNQDNEHKLVYTDKEAAKAIMEKYGYGPNNTLKLEYYYNQNAMHDTVSAVIKEQLKDIYVDVTLKTAELRTFFDDRSYGRYDLARNAFSADYMDPWNYLELMAIYNDPEGRTFFGDETYDKLLFESMELEGEARFAKLHEAETYAIETMCFNVPLFGYGSVSLQKPGTTGVINNPQANHIFWFVKCPE
ncbi:MAG: peptide ABC transporter substrate-binding protein [Erysipelotrichaceae bacterium]|nr:peptide ABC transporter substrate-binding protein [Erysipelotrichaceae bacterium]MBQ2213152.1 peptide ABC transporter substrate-binding protein [Erysipelotrichaceae bacterium]MBR3352220.1 peptide ABC transporter substrate-binding protein [Erysipelotrichaceae bacterium]